MIMMHMHVMVFIQSVQKAYSYVASAMTGTHLQRAGHIHKHVCITNIFHYHMHTHWIQSKQ